MTKIEITAHERAQMRDFGIVLDNDDSLWYNCPIGVGDKLQHDSPIGKIISFVREIKFDPLQIFRGVCKLESEGGLVITDCPLAIAEKMKKMP
jgi:hypothetical protein